MTSTHKSARSCLNLIWDVGNSIILSNGSLQRPQWTVSAAGESLQKKIIIQSE